MVTDNTKISTEDDSLNQESSETREKREDLPQGPNFLKRKRYALDNLERSIIKQLCEDGRKPFQAIARELEVDEKTVRNRISKLREMGALRIIPTAEVSTLKDCIVALVAINISSDGRKDVEIVAREMASLPMVSWVGILLGQFDLLVEVVVENWEELTQFEYVVLPSISGIATTASFLVLSHFGKRGVPFVETILQER